MSSDDLKLSGAPESRKTSRKRNPSSLSKREPSLSRAEILHRGEEASRLLQSPVFNVAVRSAIDHWQEEILRSDPMDVSVREGMYYRMRAINDALIELAGFVQLATNLSERELAEEQANTAAESAALSGLYI